MSNISSIGARRVFDDDQMRRDLLRHLRSLWGYGAVASAILDLVEIQNDITGYHEILCGSLEGPEIVNKIGFKATLEKRRAAGKKLMQVLEADPEGDFMWLEDQTV